VHNFNNGLGNWVKLAWKHLAELKMRGVAMELPDQKGGFREAEISLYDYYGSGGKNGEEIGEVDHPTVIGFGEQLAGFRTWYW
jgi:hypothetical protein